MEGRDRVRLAGSVALLAGGILLASAGCRSTRSEVPPGKPYQTTGGTPPTVGFSQEPRPSTATGMAGLFGNRAPGALVPDGRGSSGGMADVQYGTPTPGSANLGAPTDHQYGPPGTAGTDGSSPGGTSPIADSLLRSQPPISQVLAKDPYAPPPPGSNNRAGGAYP
jgi:hypothetical protein